VLLRGTDSLTYPSRKEFGLLGEIMHQMRTIHGKAQLPSLASAIGPIIPHEFAGCGAFSIKKCEITAGHTNFNSELHHLYMTQGFLTDPAIQLLQRTRIGTVSSEDCPELVVPRAVTSLKLDFGIKTCLSVGVRGVLGECSYFAFSNFDQKLISKLRTMMQILAPHLHLAYMRATSWEEEKILSRKMLILTHREEEIMRWVAEGKTNWEISIILHVSLNTVKFHLKNVYAKLGGVENRWAAVAQWQNSGSDSIRHETQRLDLQEPTP
jgi:DNA-binding CsgD family transcriptional regulator